MEDKQRIVSISESLYEKLEARRKELEARKKELENIIEGQTQHIAMLQNDLYNEQLRNNNLAELTLAIDKQKTNKPEDS